MLCCKRDHLLKLLKVLDAMPGVEEDEHRRDHSIRQSGEPVVTIGFPEDF